MNACRAVRHFSFDADSRTARALLAAELRPHQYLTAINRISARGARPEFVLYVPTERGDFPLAALR